jgi:hypothetical protein
MWSPDRRLQFELDALPLAVVTVHEGWAVDDLTFMFDRFTVLWRMRTRYALLLDTTRAHRAPNAGERQLLASWMKTADEQVTRWGVGAAIIVESALIRGSLTALSWISHSGRPIVYLASRGDGARWCAERLREANLPLTSEAQRYVSSGGVSSAPRPGVRSSPPPDR